MALPAHAGEPVSRTLTVTTHIDDSYTSAPLPGAMVSIHEGAVTDPSMADASTGSDGRVTLEFSGDASIARGIWSGTQGDLVNLEESFAEFSEDDTAVDIYFSGTFGTVSGTVSASLDGEDLADLSGAQLEVYSDGVKLQ